VAAAREAASDALILDGEAIALRPDGRPHPFQTTMRRLGRKADAVEWLRRTAENGMPNYPLFRNDPNLRGLQGDAGYERLMATLERQFVANARLVHPERAR